MKKFFLAMIVFSMILVGCCTDIERQTVVKRIEYLKSYPSMFEVLILEIEEGSLMVWSPDEKLKKFLSQIKVGDRILIEATESESSPTFWAIPAVDSRYHDIIRIVRIGDGITYKKEKKR